MWLEWSAAVFSILLGSSLRILAIVILIAGILSAARIRSGRLQHGVWTAILFATILMPLLSWIVPPMFRDIAIAERSYSFASPVLTNGTAIVVHLATVPAPSTPESGAARKLPVWPTLLLAGYGIGIMVLLVRELLGWFAMMRLARSTEPTTALPGFEAFESSAISTPLTCGILRTRIVLPTRWREWSPEKLRAVLVHERAHVARRDPLIAFLSRLNRAAFWFHPVAWWLERKLAITAEHACDDEVVSQVGESQQYAGVLLEIAEAVHRDGQRVSWEGIGVIGQGILRHRIERLLKGDVLQKVSLGRRTAVSVLCIAVVYLAAACRQETNADEIAQLRKEVAELRNEVRNSGGNPVRPNTSDLNCRNPFHVPDISFKEGPDVRQHAIAFKESNLGGRPDDENSQQWTTGSVKGDRASIDGEWVGRWNNSRSGHWVPSYKAEVKAVGDRVYIFYRDHQGRFLADLRREKDLLVGYLVGIDNPADKSTCVVRIVDTERLDGYWIGLGGNGRLDFRRKLQ